MWLDTLLEILKLTIPGLIVFITVYFVLRQFLANQYQSRLIELKKEQQGITLPLRLQAYERLTLLCERITIPSLIIRLRKDAMMAKDLQLSLMVAIQQEFEHNLSQQLYVSPELWEIVCIAKDETVNTLNRVLIQMDENASGLDFSRELFAHLANQKVLPLDKALLAIKKEAGTFL